MGMEWHFEKPVHVLQFMIVKPNMSVLPCHWYYLYVVVSHWRTIIECNQEPYYLQRIGLIEKSRPVLSPLISLHCNHLFYISVHILELDIFYMISEIH